MEHRPQTRGPRKIGQRHEKTKAKTREKKQQTREATGFTAENVQSSQEAVVITRSRLTNLGNQIFGLPPFSAYFNRWLLNFKNILSEFESSFGISFDEEFQEEYSHILSKIELAFEELRRKEVSIGEALEKLSKAKILLERLDEEHAGKMKELERQKASEIRQLSSSIDVLQEELNRTIHSKRSLFRAISQKTKMQELETSQKLSSTKEELAATENKFQTLQEQLQADYEQKKEPILRQISESQKATENQEIDHSLETRRMDSEALTTAINKFLQRNFKQGNVQ